MERYEELKMDVIIFDAGDVLAAVNSDQNMGGA